MGGATLPTCAERPDGRALASCHDPGRSPTAGPRPPIRPGTPSRRSGPRAALGADWVELDVRRTADGALVVHHDAAPARRSGWSPSCAADELPAGCRLLDAALDACGGMGVNVEIKVTIRRRVGTAVAAMVDARRRASCERRGRPDRFLRHLASTGRLIGPGAGSLAPSCPPGCWSSTSPPGRTSSPPRPPEGHAAVNPWDPCGRRRARAAGPRRRAGRQRLDGRRPGPHRRAGRHGGRRRSSPTSPTSPVLLSRGA